LLLLEQKRQQDQDGKICNRITKHHAATRIKVLPIELVEKNDKASWYRAEKNDDGDTRDVIERMAKLRLQANDG
jgi:hypothetical protein